MKKVLIIDGKSCEVDTCKRCGGEPFFRFSPAGKWSIECLECGEATDASSDLNKVVNDWNEEGDT